MTIQEIIINTMIWTLNVLIIAATTIFLVNFTKMSRKNLGLYMILTLNLFCWVYTFSDIFQLFFTWRLLARQIAESIKYFVFEFSLFWTAAFAIFSYNVLEGAKSGFDQKRFFVIALVSCILLSLGYPFLIATESLGLTVRFDADKVLRVQYPIKSIGHQILYFIFFNVIGEIIPSIIICISYYKVYKKLQAALMYFSQESTKNLRKILVFSGVPLLYFLPLTIADLICMYHDEPRPFGVNLWRSLAFRSWFLVNLLNYWFLAPANSESRNSSFIEEDIPKSKTSSINSATVQ